MRVEGYDVSTDVVADAVDKVFGRAAPASRGPTEQAH